MSAVTNEGVGMVSEDNTHNDEHCFFAGYGALINYAEQRDFPQAISATRQLAVGHHGCIWGDVQLFISSVERGSYSVGLS